MKYKSMCEWCGEAFETNNRTAKFCSLLHYRMFLETHKTNRNIKRTVTEDYYNKIAVFVLNGQYDQNTATIEFNDGTKFKIVKV